MATDAAAVHSATVALSQRLPHAAFHGLGCASEQIGEGGIDCREFTGVRRSIIANHYGNRTVRHACRPRPLHHAVAAHDAPGNRTACDLSCQLRKIGEVQRCCADQGRCRAVDVDHAGQQRGSGRAEVVMRSAGDLAIPRRHQVACAEARAFISIALSA